MNLYRVLFTSTVVYEAMVPALSEYEAELNVYNVPWKEVERFGVDHIDEIELFEKNYCKEQPK